MLFRSIVNFRCSDASLIGQFVQVHIDEALPHSLRGTLLAPVASGARPPVAVALA